MKVFNQSLIKKSMSLVECSARFRYSVLFFVLFGIRSFYIAFAGNYAGDTALYLNIANNIAAGQGFSYALGDGASSVVPVVGGYFPAYPSLLALFQLLNLGVVQIALLVGGLYVASVIYLSSIIYIITKNQRLSSIMIIVLGIPPTGFGFSRFLLIEPILGALGILILALCLKFNFRCGNRRLTFALLCLLFVSAIYFKPTAIVFLAPICLTLLASLGLIAGLKATLVVGVTSFLLIMPWGIRNILLGANTLFPAHANIFPINISGISLWVKSWAVTEYDYTKALFPIWSGEIQKVAIDENLFLDAHSASNALELIRVNSNSSLSSETDLAFSKLSASLNSPTPLNFLRILVLKILQSISLILHPANSWGLPIEVSSKGNMINPSTTHQFAIYIQNIPKIVAKLLLFVWRLFFYSVLSISSIRLLSTGKFISRLSRIALNPDNRSIGPLMVLLSLSLFLSTLILFVGFFTALEHRYLYPVVPWIEAACICFMFRPVMTLNYSS